jgi:hypothetical protein
MGALVREPGWRDGVGRGTRFAADGVRLYGPLRVALIVWLIAA